MTVLDRITLSLNSMSQRERRMVYLCAGVALLVVIFGVIVPLDRSVTQAQHRVQKKTADLGWMRSVAPQFAMLPAPMANPSKESLLVVIDRSAHESDLGKNVVGSEPSGSGGLRVRLEKAPFDRLIGWLARMSDQQGIRVDSAQFDNAGTPGTVNAAVVLSTR